jgi:deazaflavin-dependent oxidoreductase (nitroreductase family)
VALAEFAHLTTRGRRSGRPHTVELWFAPVGSAVWFIAGGGTSSDWVANLVAEPAVRVRVGERTFAGRARTEAGDAGGAGEARRLLAARYQGWEEGRPLSDWAAHGLAVAVDLEG